MSSNTWDRSGDPLVYFLKEMRAENLLDAQSEIKLAKTIARGKKHLISIVFSLPFCLDTLNRIGEKLKSGEFRVSELVHLNEGGDAGEDEECSNEQGNVNSQFQRYVEKFEGLAEISRTFFPHFTLKLSALLKPNLRLFKPKKPSIVCTNPL